MKIKSLFLTFFVILGMASSFAQDIHFSQFYASPLTLNPALTGKFNGLWRATAIYRDQYRPIVKGDAFVTPSVSVDFSLLKNKLKTDALGIGAVAFYDQAGNFQTFRAGLSMAYHKGLDKNGNYHLALGIQGMYGNRSIDPTFDFQDELENSVGYVSPDQTALDQIDANHSIDMNAGALFDARFTDAITFFAGYSFMNILRHKDDFIPNTIGNEENQTAFRHVAHGGFEFWIKNKFLLNPGALYQTTLQAREINFGNTFGYKIIGTGEKKKETIILLGAWYRLGNNNLGNTGSAIIKGGLDFQNFRVTGAYDLGVGQIKDDGNNAVGRIPTAFEIALSYFGGSKPLTADRYLFNPRF